VAGVLPEDFRGLAIGPPDYWSPLALAGQYRDDTADAESLAVDVIGRLAPGTSPESAAAALSAWASRRAQERIGVRVALGATVTTVARLVASQVFRSVGIGLAAGTGLAAAVATLLMSSPSATEIGRLVHVVDPVAYLTGILVIAGASVLAASLPMLRAARIDPIVALRDE
jgi:hypothetical protein